MVVRANRLLAAPSGGHGRVGVEAERQLQHLGGEFRVHQEGDRGLDHCNADGRSPRSLILSAGGSIGLGESVVTDAQVTIGPRISPSGLATVCTLT